MPSETVTESKVMVGLFDVLGFSDRVRRTNLKTIFAEYEGLIKVVTSKIGSLIIRSMANDDGTHSPAVGYLTTEHAYFSDTILLWSRFDDFRYPAFCSLCAMLVCEALTIRMPLRGAISIGPAVLDKTKNTFIGAAIVEAHEVEQAQAWLGVSYAASAVKYIQNFDPRLILPYESHGKEGKQHLIEGAVLDWPRIWRDSNRDDLTSALLSLQDYLGKHPYIEAAITFACYSQNRHDWFLTHNTIGVSDATP